MSTRLMSHRKFRLCLQICSWLMALNFPLAAFGADDFGAGPLFSQFALTLDLGSRDEAIGPFFYSQKKDSEKDMGCPTVIFVRHGFRH